MQRFLDKDFLAGLLFLAFGLAAMHIADRDYPMGTVMRMGPGNFPLWLGWVLAGFGVFLAARGIWHMVRGAPRSGAPPPEKEPALDFVQGDRAPGPVAWTWPEAAWRWRAMACIVASMLAFGYLMPRLGLVPALVPMFFIAAFGGREFRWREVTVLTVVMTVLAVGVFVVLLKLPFQLFRGFYLV
ncbi:MAG TPA: tripartite tricarboxylate transporter TctB family protein [Burkholderiales bacterium]|nr:tripartite tricarboxylate transporter TctB family protein [Burkholderiales bacterium]